MRCCFNDDWLEEKKEKEEKTVVRSAPDGSDKYQDLVHVAELISGQAGLANSKGAGRSFSNDESGSCQTTTHFLPTWVALLGLVSSTRCSRSDVSPLFLDQMPKWPQYHLRHQICQTGKIIEMTDPTEPTHPSLQGAREVIG